MIRCRYILFTMVICVIAGAASAELTDGLIIAWIRLMTVHGTKQQTCGILGIA